MARRRVSILARWLLVGALVCTLFPMPAFAESDTTRCQINAATAGQTIRVGFVNQPGSFFIDENGRYSGYTYEYLVQLAQYTGWNYEFIPATGDDENSQILNTLDMLETGKIDLLGMMNYSSELSGLYEYPHNSYGSFHPCLFVANNTDNVSKTNIFTLSKLTVAVLRTSKIYRDQLIDFCTKNNIELIQIECASYEEMAIAVNTGEADALLDLDINLHPDFHIATTFQQRPVFFAAEKGSSDIVSAIDEAIESLNVGNPTLQSDLYKKYYEASGSDLSLTPEEQAYAAAHKPLRVGIVTNKAPIQNIDENGILTGVTKGVLDHISESSGLQFEIVPLEFNSDLAQTLRENNITLVAGIDQNFSIASQYNLSLTAPYVTANTLVVFNKAVDPSDLTNLKLALPQELAQGSAFANGAEIITFDTMEKCFAAVNKGLADYTYGNTYTTPYYINLGSFTNLKFIPVSISTSQTSFGLVSPIDPTILLIFNKTIRSIPTSTLNSMIYEASLPSQNDQFELFIKTYLVQIFIGGMAVLLVIIILLALLLRTRMKATKAARKENQRHREIYRISNEQFFEYAPQTDTLLMSTPSERNKHENILEKESDESAYRTYEQVSTRTDTPLSSDLLSAITNPQKPIVDLCHIDKTNKQVWLRITSRIITDENGKPMTIIGKITDINEETVEKINLSKRAEQDGLTGLLNRATFQEKVTRLLEDKMSGAFIVVDIDYLKEVNDTYGHFAGDEALRNVAQLLLSEFRPKDLLCRLGGDEFSAFIAGPITQENIAIRCSRMIEKGVNFFKENAIQHQTSVSIGVALLREGSYNYDEVYQLADEALYEAKRRGRSQYVVKVH
ncbi:MAG: GGDEF domain-containing protein [Gordonibacter sp.]|nr:GGDEF domain-containing protein [Gordonibacter sp.]